MGRLVRATALTCAVLTAYGAGVLTGVVGSADPVVAPAAQVKASPQGVIDEAADRIAAHAARQVDREVLEQAAVEGMLEALGDRWSSFYRPSDYASLQEALDGRYSGVGIWLRPGEHDGSIVVGSVAPGSPAARAGILGGERVLAVDGHPVSGLQVAEVAAMLRGDGGTNVELTLSAGTSSRVVALARTTFTTADVTVEHLSDSVLGLRVSAFTRGVGRALRNALAEDRAAYRGGIVLDLRGNPGGLLDEAVEVASAFLDGGPVVSFERRNQARTTMDALGTGDTRTPLVVLVDQGTASAAEVVAGALQDRDRAVVVGTQTFGKGSVQEPTTLSDGSAIELTVGRYFTPDGRVIDGVGLQPDVLVAPSAPPATAERRATEVLSGLMAALAPSGRG
ncbi:MAG TPA: S41 family peptidase [Actinomycetes bacterium]|nr:S41 family peptidase [Actinomycetes bacterium]